MDSLRLDEIEFDPLSLQRGDMVVKDPSRTQYWEEILRLEPLPRTQPDSCQRTQMERGSLQVGRCHRCSSFLICSEDLLELRLSWICAEAQKRPETVDEICG